MTKAMTILLGVTASIVGLAGGALAWSGLHYVRDDLVAPGTSLIVASLVALTAAGGYNTWAAERARTRDAKAREAYEALSMSLIERFEVSPLATTRAQVATWAHPRVVQAMSNWNRTYDKYVPRDAKGEVSLSEAAQVDMRSATVRVIAAIRSDLGRTTVKADVESALFNHVKARRPFLGIRW